MYVKYGIKYTYYTCGTYNISHILVTKNMFAPRPNVQDISPTSKIHTTLITVVSTCLINVLILTLSSGLGMG